MKANGRKNALATGREGGEREPATEAGGEGTEAGTGTESVTQAGEKFQSVKKYLNPTLMKNFLHNP